MSRTSSSAPSHTPSLKHAVLWWLWPAACLIVLAGYFAPWIDHAAAGLVVTGLDLGEYVKFLPEVRDGTIEIWRQGFYLPLLAVSLACSLFAYRPIYRYSLISRLALLMLGVVAALNMLPPAWSPAVLASGEFRLQSVWIALCLGATALSPLLALLPAPVPYLTVAVLSIAGLWLPISGFLNILPGVNALYQRAPRIGWGPYTMALGLAALIIACLIALRVELRAHAPEPLSKE